ncbi:MAG: hypothetical protein AVDCRST_MAG74-2562 [uncultured Pyrinomonadaceae bacterium]|uniref:DUF2231 domain-containing protein n=1 Tax=uncultured Pyrinomonadaceae bacterium TaxID=2283094 RepID=A0A6J4PGH6_9BACT|nr:MAG: hypothetical protein AVDCRST_MAG74-2562 [uncultured Pyrinomonadaceae bacterium]
MPKTTFAGHALHPQLVLIPGGLLPFSAVLDAMNVATGDQSYADAAYYTLVGGLVGGLAAGAAGAADYLTIPPESGTKRTANLHATLNIAALGLTGLNLLLRSRRRDEPVGGLALLSIATAAGVLVSGWYGGKMSYDQGMRVKGVSEVENAPELKLPGDEAIHQAFERLEEAVAPTGGPATPDARRATTAAASTAIEAL